MRNCLSFAAVALAALVVGIQSGAAANSNVVRGCVLKPTANGTLVSLCR